jgi:hypothetical protein
MRFIVEKDVILSKITFIRLAASLLHSTLLQNKRKKTVYYVN